MPIITFWINVFFYYAYATYFKQFNCIHMWKQFWFEYVVPLNATLHILSFYEAVNILYTGICMRYKTKCIPFHGILFTCEPVLHMSQCMRFPTMWYVRPAKAQTSLRICAVWSEPCSLLEYSMSVKLLTKHPLEVLSLKTSCRGLSESTLLKMLHCWKSHVTVHLHVSRQASWSDASCVTQCIKIDKP